MVAAQVGPRFRALGSEAGYLKYGLDVQEEALRSGAGPGDAGFGEEPRESWGLLGTDDDSKPVETERGRYVAYYEAIEAAIRAAGPPPVPLEAGIETLRIIEAARKSAAERTVVPL
jgi:predicted dehydrogenase